VSDTVLPSTVPDATDDAAVDSGSDHGLDGPNADADDTAPSGSCDMTGTWAGKTSAYALDTLLFASQLSNIWYYLEIEDHGDEIEIVGGFNCGIRVEGAASVTLTAAATEALRLRNSPIGRMGEFYADGETCHFTMERTFLLRGGDVALLPADFTEYEGPDALDRLDVDIPLPTPEDLSLAVDIDGDGQPGIAFHIGGAVTGSRNVVQRDWNQMFSSPDYSVLQASTDDFTVDFDYDVTESLLSVTDCDFGCGLLEAGSAPDPDGDHHTRFVRVRPEDVEGETDLETCFNVQDLIPWEAP
jgi:hypothetical protein